MSGSLFFLCSFEYIIFFMGSAAISIHSARLSQAGISRQVLKDGASVLVRIIGDKGNGKYEGSVAGVRVQLSSSRTFKAGESFPATVSVKDGKIIVTPKNEASAALEMPLTFSRNDEAVIAAFLEGAGLSSDSLSISILQQIKQVGLKIDAQFMSRIHNLALRFKGKEKSASEILVILAEKGLSASDDEILELLEMLNGDKTFCDYEGKNQEEDPGNKKEKLINRINKNEGKWYLLPFELIQYGEINESSLNSNGGILGKGLIRLLFESNNRLRLMNIDASYNNTKYLFSLLFEGKQCKELRFNISACNFDSSIIEKKTEDLRKRFMKAGLIVPEIKYCAAEVIDGSACACEEFYSFGGEL